MENNKLIATFMGLLRSDEPVSGLGHGKYHWFYKRPFLWDESLCSDEELKYDTSWSWLIPVVDKIEKTNRINDQEYYPYMVTIWKNCCTITDGNNGDEIVIVYDIDKLTATYNAIVTFIKWYNGKKE